VALGWQTDNSTQDELAQGKVRFKEMGLPADHPLKEGELISFENLEEEVQQRLTLKKQLDSIARQAAGLRVVHGIKGEDVKASADSTPASVATGKPTTATSELLLAAQAAERPGEVGEALTGQPTN